MSALSDFLYEQAQKALNSAGPILRTNIKGYIDRRGPRELEAARALEQARADKALQERFEEGVRQREMEMLRRKAS